MIITFQGEMAEYIYSVFNFLKKKRLIRKNQKNNSRLTVQSLGSQQNKNNIRKVFKMIIHPSGTDLKV